MRCLKLDRFRKSVGVGRMPTPKGEFTVRVKYAAINPSDMAFLLGNYGKRREFNFPVVPGFEGSGEIVDGPADKKQWVGKNVSFMVNSEDPDLRGSWGQFARVSEANMLDLKEIPLKQGAALSINALSAIGILNSLNIEEGIVAVNSARSSIGKMLIRLLKQRNCTVIRLVRNRSEGGDYVLPEAEPIFKAEVDYVDYFLDGVCDKSSEAVSSKAKRAVCVYGMMGNSGVATIPAKNLLFDSTKLFGFWLPSWMATQSLSQIKQHHSFIHANLDLFHYKTASTYPIEQFSTAQRSYLKDMSKGKVLLEF